MNKIYRIKSIKFTTVGTIVSLTADRLHIFDIVCKSNQAGTLLLNRISRAVTGRNFTNLDNFITDCLGGFCVADIGKKSGRPFFKELRAIMPSDYEDDEEWDDVWDDGDGSMIFTRPDGSWIRREYDEAGNFIC